MSKHATTTGLFRGAGNPYLNPQTFDLIGPTLTPADLFDVLDLTQPVLTAVRVCADGADFPGAARALLACYRARTDVAWPSWPDDGEQPRGVGAPVLTASEADFVVAGNAIRHVFQPYAAFPPTDYGPDIDWDWNPHGNIEWPAHMHRMTGWDLSVARCYAASGDERYAQCWVDLTTDWILKNPVTRERCYFPQSWDAIQVGIRSTRWSGLLPHFLNSPSCTPDFLVLLLTSIYNHARRSHAIPYPRLDNFAIIESAGLADIALAFPEFSAAPQWRAAAFERLDVAMRDQVLPDGTHGELSPAYHLYCASLFLGVAETALRNGHAVAFTAGVERMAEVLLGIATPQRCLPVVGDASPSDIRAFMRKAARAFGRADFLAAATGGAEGAWPAWRNTGFKAGGFYAFRSDWSPQAVWMCLHCGPASIQPTAFHSQFDNGTFELMAGGRYLMRDPGVYCYARDDPRREAFRRTAAHQTLTLDGANSVRAGRLLKWIEDDGAGNALLVVENDSYPGLAHRRSVFFIARRYFVLVDEARGTAQGALDLHFQFTPAPLEIDAAAMTARTRFAEDANVLLWVDRAGVAAIQPEEAWFSPQHNEKEPLPAVRIRHLAPGAPARFLSVIAPFDGAVAPEVSAALVHRAAGDDDLRVILSVNGEQYECGA
jgi:heparan-sulfate lyase